jgi:cytochrome c biogenesis protein CcmG/thiol:disulfide interchange protein DsbE
MVFRKFVIAILAVTFWVGLSPDAGAAISVGQKAPALVVTDTAGKKVDLNGMKGKTVIVTLWASWCAPCLGEIPMLRDFYHKYEDQGVEIIALSLDGPHDKKAVEKIAAKVDYHVAMASDATANGFDEAGSLPVTYVIDTEGNVSAVFNDGPATEKELVGAVVK